jgi:hypothetical protein
MLGKRNKPEKTIEEDENPVASVDFIPTEDLTKKTKKVKLSDHDNSNKK